MEEKQSRVRWNDQELGQLAAVMAPRLLADPQLHPLEAVRAAQECLEPGRRRELKAWSLVEGRLQPKLEAAMARLRALSTQPGVDEGPLPADSQVSPTGGRVDVADANVLLSQAGDAQTAGSITAEASGPSRRDREAVQAPQSEEVAAAEPDATQAPGHDLDLYGNRSDLQGLVPAGGAVERATAAPSAPRHDDGGRTANSATLDPATIEAALVAALQSPLVEEALVELFARTMSKALLRAGTGELRPLPGPLSRQSPARRVLLAGFPEAQQEALREALGASFEVRSWKPAHGPQLFQTLARLCKTVVFPEEADDEVDASLKDMDVRVIRHAGNASRLIERIAELG